MADRELTILLKFAKQAAERAAQQFHEGERRRIRETGEVQEAIDRERDHNLRQRSRQLEQDERRLSRQYEQRAKQRAKAEEDAEARIRKARQESARAHNADLAGVIRGYQQFDAIAKRSLSTPFNLATQSLQRFRRETLALLKDIKIDPSVTRGLSAQVEAEGRKLAAVMKRLGDMNRQSIMSMGSGGIADMKEMMEQFSRWAQDDLRETNAALKAIRKENQTEEKRDADEEAERVRRFSRRRVETYAGEAKERAAVSRKMADEALELSKKAEEAERKGLTETAESYRKHASQKAHLARQAYEESTKLAKRASEASTEAIKGENFAVREVIKGTVESAREASRGAKAHFDDVRQVATHTFDAQKKGAKETGEEIHKNSRQISVLAQQYIMLRTAERTVRFIHEAWQAVVQSTSDANKYIEGMVEKTDRLRESLEEYQRMAGRPANAASTAEDLDRFARAGLSSQAGVAAVKEFEAQAGTFIGEGPHHRMTRAQEKEFTEFSMPLAASIGLADAEGQKAAQMIGATMMQHAPLDPKTGKVDVKKLKLEYAKAIKTVQKAIGGNAPAAHQFAEGYRMHAFNAKNDAEREELQLIFSAMSEVSVDGERVLMDALFRGMDQITEEDNYKGHNRYEELGFRSGMSDLERLHAADKAIQDIAKREGKSYDEVARFYFNEQREHRAIRGYRGMLETGGDKRLMEERNAVTLPGAQQEIRGYLATTEAQGRSLQTANEAKTARRVAEGGYKEFENLRLRKRGDIISGATLEEGERFWDAYASKKTAELGLGNREEYLQHQMVGAEIRERLQKLAAAGSEDAASYLKQKGHRLDISKQYFVADQAAQAEAFNKVRLLERERDNNVKAGRAPFASNLAVQQAARERALSQLQAEGVVPPGMTTGKLDAAAARRRIDGGHTAGGEYVLNPRNDPMGNSIEAVEERAARIVAEQRKKHADNEAILRDLSPGAANQARRRLQVVIPPGLMAAEHVSGLRLSRRRDGSVNRHITPPGASGFRPMDAAAIRRMARRLGPGGAAPIEILTDAERAERAAKARARSERAAAREMAVRAKGLADAEPQLRVARQIERNRIDTFWRHQAANPAPPPPIPRPEFPDYGWGKGPMARAAHGMLAQRGPDPQPKSFNDAMAAWSNGYATPQDRGVVMQGRAAFAQQGSSPHGAGAGAALLEAARALKGAAGPPIPPAMPGKPYVMK